jgi:hypothetical protein
MLCKDINKVSPYFLSEITIVNTKESDCSHLVRSQEASGSSSNDAKEGRIQL